MSNLKLSSIENATGTKYIDGTDFVRGTARAFVDWSGVPRSECNVGSVTFISVGVYRIDFRTPFRTATYGMVGSSNRVATNSAQITQPYILIANSRSNKTTSHCHINILIEATGAVADAADWQVFFIGD